MSLFYILFDLKGPTECSRRAVIVRSHSQEDAKKQVRDNFESEDSYVIVKIYARRLPKVDGPPRIVESLPV